MNTHAADGLKKWRESRKAQAQDLPTAELALTGMNETAANPVGRGVDSPQALTDGQKATFRNVPESMNGVYLRAYSGKSKSAGLKAKCLECCCDQRHFVRDCKISGCPLWTYRPYRIKPGETQGTGDVDDDHDGEVEDRETDDADERADT